MIEKLFSELPRFFEDEDELRRPWSKPDPRKALRSSFLKSA
jgi:type I restriction enzyme, R subunit